MRIWIAAPGRRRRRIPISSGRGRLMQPFVDQSRKDSGSVRFDIVHQTDRTNHFTAIEAWVDQKADDAHELASHTKTFRGGINPLLGALYDQRRYKPL